MCIRDRSTLARNLRLLLKEEAMIFSMDDYLAMSRGKHETALDAVCLLYTSRCV